MLASVSSLPVAVVGAERYGRAPTTLMRTGYEPVRSVVAALGGDMAAAVGAPVGARERGAEGCCQ